MHAGGPAWSHGLECLCSTVLASFSNVQQKGGCLVSDKKKKDNNPGEKAAVTLPGTVEKVISPLIPGMPEKAQISIEGAEDLYKEIRVENSLEDEAGNQRKLKKGAEVQVTIEADADSTTPKK